MVGIGNPGCRLDQRDLQRLKARLEELSDQIAAFQRNLEFAVSLPRTDDVKSIEARNPNAEPSATDLQDQLASSISAQLRLGKVPLGISKDLAQEIVADTAARAEAAREQGATPSVKLPYLRWYHSENPLLRALARSDSVSDAQSSLSGASVADARKLIEGALTQVRAIFANRTSLNAVSAATIRLGSSSSPVIASRAGESVVLSPMSDKYTLQKIAVSLSGGGSSGDFQTGALRFLYDNVFDQPDIIAGTSVGAVNGALLAEGTAYAMDVLEETWNKLERQEQFYTTVLDFKNLLDTLLAGAQSDVTNGVLGSVAGGVLTGVVGFFISDLIFQNVKEDIQTKIDDLLKTVRGLRSMFSLNPIRSAINARLPAWSPTGPGVRGASLAAAAQAAGAHSDGGTVLAARGYDNLCYLALVTTNPAKEECTVSRWVPILSKDELDATINSDPIFLTDTKGVATGVFARRPLEIGGKKTVGRFFRANVPYDFEKLPQSSWPAWEDTLGTPDGIPELTFRTGSAVGSWATYIQDIPGYILACDTRGIPWSWTEWGGWRLIRYPIPLAAGIRGVIDSQSSLLVFGRTVWDNGIVVCHGDPKQGQFGDWEPFKNALDQSILKATGEITAIRDNENTVHVLFNTPTDIGHSTWLVRETPWHQGWEEPFKVAENLATSNIAAILGNDARVRIFVRGSDNAVWMKDIQSVSKFGPVDTGWVSLGTPSADISFLTDPIVHLTSDKRIEVYAVGTDHRIYLTYEVTSEPAARFRRDFTRWLQLPGTVWTAPEFRVATVCLETSDTRIIDQSWRLSDDPEGRTIRVNPADAIIASAAIPAIFEPVNLPDGRTYVDGGVRTSVPTKAAIDAGATVVYAIACDSRHPSPLHYPLLGGAVPASDFQSDNLLDIGLRAATSVMPAAIMDDDLYPPNPWPVPVYVIQPTIDAHSGLIIDAALIHISIGYGWMRAFDILMTSAAQTREAIETSDAITRKRLEIQFFEQFIHNLQVVGLWIVPLRPLKEDLARLVADRKARGYDVPPDGDSWAFSWEYPKLAQITGLERPQDSEYW